jgi:hypothetical protein
VGQALRVVGALEGGKKGVTDGRAIADRILKALDERGAEAFPSLQEGTTRAEAGGQRARLAEATLDAAEVEALDPLLGHDERSSSGASRRTSPPAAPGSARLPSTPAEVSARRAACRPDGRHGPRGVPARHRAGQHARDAGRHAEVGGGHPRPAAATVRTTRSSSPSG